jgi:autotransporter-associated beta strand protein
MKPNPKQTLKITRAFSLASAIILSAASVPAADRFWSGGTASYNNAASWGGTLPGGGDNAINNSGAANTVLISASDPNWTINDIRSGDGGANQGPWLQTGANVTLNGWFRIGIGSGVGKYEMSGGTLTVNAARFNVGEGGTALFNFTGGTINKNGGGDFAVPDGGTGVMNQTNGTLNINSGEFWVGQGGSANGTYNLVSNGVITVNNWVAIARGGGTAVFNMSDNSSVTKAGANVFIVGAGGTGTWNQNGGGVTNSATDSWLGEGGTGIWNMNAGSTVLAYLQLGRNGGSSGTLNLNGGAFAVNRIDSGGGSGTVNFNGGTLRARVASANFMVVPGFLQAGGAVIDSQANDITISATLADGAGGTLTKIGSGTLTLTGPNTYPAKTIVSVGKLVESTTTTAPGDVSVANAAGYGVSLAVANGQVTHSSVTFAGAANSANFLLGGFGNPSVGALVATALTNNGTTTVNVTGSGLSVGQFPLIQYTTKTGAGTFVVGTLPAGVSATVINNVGNSSIDLNITSTALIRWDGEVAGGNWDINITTNWTDYLTALPAKFINGAAVYFDDLALGTTNVNLVTNVSPGTVIVTNDALSYTISGTGAINGATALTKQGANTLTITTTNGYTGVTTISGGTVSINKLANGGSPSGIGAGSTNPASLVLDGGTLSYTGPTTSTDRGYSLVSGNSKLDLQNDLTSTGAVSPVSGANFAKTGNGTLSLKRAGANTLSLGGGVGAWDVYNGTVIMDGSASGQANSVTGELSVGTTTNSTGPSLVLTNTTLNVSSWFSLSRGTGNGGYTSTVTLYNSALKSVNSAMCYDNGFAGTLQSAVLTLNGTSTFTNNGDSNMGESPGGNATINLNDSSVYYSNNRMLIGMSGTATGTVTVASSAKVVVNAWMSIGNTGGTGSMLIKDNGTLVCGDLNVCDVNTGLADLTAKDNAVVNAGNIFVGKGNGSVGTFTITNNAAVVSANGLTIASTGGAASDGTTTLSGGSLAVNLVQGMTGNSTFNFNGGKLIARNPFAANFMFNLTAINVLAGSAFIDSSNATISIAQPLLDGGTGGGLTKLGTGTLLLNGASTYTGNTVVSAGTLGGTGTLASAVTVQSGTTLAPGAGGIGTLTINNNLTIAGDVAVDVNTTNSPATNDLVVVSGTLTKTGAGTLTVANQGPALSIGDSFTLFSQPVTGGAALTVSGGGVIWTNKLAIDGSIAVLSFIAPPSVTPGGVVVLPNGNISLTATGVVGSTYKLWATTNLLLSPIATTWTQLNSGTVTASPFTIIDSTATNSMQKFYIFSTP